MLALVYELTGAALDVLVMVDELTELPQIRPDALDAPDFVGIGSKPARQDGQRGRRSGGAVSLGTVPAGTTEAQVDDMMMVLEVAGEACPTPNRPRPDMTVISIPLI